MTANTSICGRLLIFCQILSFINNPHTYNYYMCPFRQRLSFTMTDFRDRDVMRLFLIYIYRVGSISHFLKAKLHRSKANIVT